MEGQKKNSGLVLTLIIFILLTLCLGGFILYDKLNETSNENTSIESNTINTTSKYANNEISNENSTVESNTVDTEAKNTNNELKAEVPSKISVTDFYFDSVAILNEGSVYVNVYGSTPQIDTLFGDGTFQTLVATRNNYKEYTFNNFEYRKDNSNFKGMKLNVSNIEAVYSYENGQALSTNYGLILLNKDKTLSIISLYSLINGKTDVKSISNLSGITSVVSSDNGGITTYAIKENGEKIDLNDYIPEDYTQF
ncbi:MAG: hypothetical protein ACI4VN_00230 [Clostridia bacterium]